MKDDENHQPVPPAPRVDIDKVYGWANQPDASSVHDSHSVPAASTKPHGRFRKYFLYILIAGVIVSALISIVAILIGEINDYIARALWTTLSMVVHAMIALSFISVTVKKRSRGQEIVINTLFVITVASFFTSTLGIWKVVSGQTVGDFYQLYFYALIAVLIIQMMLSVNTIDKITNRLMVGAMGLTVFLWVYLIPSVFDNDYPRAWPEVYYRGIAAIGIVLGTVLILVTIFHKLYLTKHPEQKPVVAKSGGMPTWLIVLLCIVGIPMALVYLSSILGFLSIFLMR